MKKLVAILLCSIPLSLLAQDNDYTMYQTIEIVPDNKALDKLNANLKTHNERFHNQGNRTAFVWRVASGPSVGHLIWMRGPLKFADLDTPLGADHDEHWAESVMPYVKNIKTLEYWRRLDKISNVLENPSPKIYIRMFKINKGQSYRTNEMFGKVNEAIKHMDGDNPWAVWTNLFLQGDMGRHIAAVSGFNSWAWIDEDDNFKKHYMEVHGENSWIPFINMQREIIEDSYDAIWILDQNLSAGQ